MSPIMKNDMEENSAVRKTKNERIKGIFNGGPPYLVEELREKRTAYALGFLFMPDLPSPRNQFQGHEVVLIRKNRPDWQRGLLNGVGGHVEDGESALEAMTREFTEEAGSTTAQWHPVVDMIFDDCIVHVFAARLTESRSFPSKTDERIEIWNVSDVLGYPNKIPNLNWLIPLALCNPVSPKTPKMFF